MEWGLQDTVEHNRDHWDKELDKLATEHRKQGLLDSELNMARGKAVRWEML